MGWCFRSSWLVTRLGLGSTEGPHSNKMECFSHKRVPWRVFGGPSPNTSVAARQGPRRHPKGTTVEKINRASSLLRPAAEKERGARRKREREGVKSRAGIPMQANCLVGRLPELWCEQSTLTEVGEDEIPFSSSWSHHGSHLHEPCCSFKT